MRACWTARRFVQLSRDAMDTMPGRLLCIDLQVDPLFGIEPEAKAIFSARQLLTMGRRLGWEIVHARRRIPNAPNAGLNDARTGAMRPLMSERVFFRSGRTIRLTSSPTRGSCSHLATDRKVSATRHTTPSGAIADTVAAKRFVLPRKVAT